MATAATTTLAGTTTARRPHRPLLTALLTLRLLPVLPAVFAALLAAGLYPLLAVPFARAQRSLAEPERA